MDFEAQEKGKITEGRDAGGKGRSFENMNVTGK